MKRYTRTSKSLQRRRSSFRPEPKARNVLGLIAGTALAGTLLPAAASGQQIVNPISAFDITVDGQFTGGVSNGALQGEWSDITPAAFISPAAQNGSLFSTTLGDPRTNSLLYGALDPGHDNIYLMYDYLPRTNPNFNPGEVAAQISFPVITPQGGVFGTGGPRDITVKFVAFNNTSAASRRQSGFLGDPVQAGNGFNVIVHGDAENGNPAFDVLAAQLGMEGKIGFGPSTLSATAHMLTELSVPLVIPAGFSDPANGGAFPGNGIDPTTGGYSPDPKFWGSDIVNNGGDPPATAANFQILPNGNTIINPTGPLANVPEPSSLALFGGSLTILLACRRRRRSRRL